MIRTRSHRGGVLGPNELGRVFGELTATKRIGWEECGALYEFACTCGRSCERVITEVRYQVRMRAIGKRKAPVACRECVSDWLAFATLKSVRSTMKHLGEETETHQGV